MDRHQVVRAKFPATSIDFVGSDSFRAELGGSGAWYWGMPGVHRALAAPHAFNAVPAAPERGDEHAQSLGYWSALHNLLVYRLGWSRPDRGLRWWYDAGKPTDDPTLALISEIWDRDGRLDGYLAWLLRLPQQFLNDSGGFPVPAEGESLTREWARWLEETTRSHTVERYEWFQYHFEGDSLHLSGSGMQERAREHAAAINILDPLKRRALFWAKRADAWYFNLTELGRTLPEIGERSWHVDVVIEPLGFLGTFRQSRSTGLWFSGRHKFHSPGN